MSHQTSDGTAKNSAKDTPHTVKTDPATDRSNFLKAAGGYLLGGLAGVGFLVVAYWVGIGGWLVKLLPTTQPFLRLLAVPLIAGLFLFIGGGILGWFGGWSIGKLLGTKKRQNLAIGSGIAYGITTGLLVPVFLLVVSFFALYNNLATNKFEHFGLLFGLFGLIFGLVLGLLQAFLTLRLPHTWRIILASLAGFSVGGILMGILVRLVTTANLFKSSSILAWLILGLAMVIPITISGGIFGFTYGRLARRTMRAGKAVDTILPSRWQVIFVAVLGSLAAISILGLLGNITNFLTINPGFVQSQIAPLTDGVAWSEPDLKSRETLPIQPTTPDRSREVAQVTGPDGKVHRAWCSSEGRVQYQVDGNSIEEIAFPSCSQTPALALDINGLPHLVWYTQEIRDTTGVVRSASLLVESIRKSVGATGSWTEAAIIAQTQGEVLPSLTADTQGNLHLVWNDTSGETTNVFHSVQENYQCSEDDLSKLERAGLEAIMQLGTRPTGIQPAFCRNQFRRIIYTPNPEPTYSDQQATINGGFDWLSSLADQANYEVLFTTMQWEENVSPPNPGSILAEAVAYLYNQVKANPDKFPRGMTVRILLGNYPVMADFTWGSQIYEVITQMREAGIEKMVDPEIGWRLEVANYPGTYPHSHTKFLVIDGKVVTGAGFNYGYLHFPKDHPSGKGYDLFDLGLTIAGPVAQEAIAVYDDLWSGANQIYCEDFYPEDGSDWAKTCQEMKAISDHVPEVLRTSLPPDGETNSFSLYRTMTFKEGDEFIAASLDAASKTIDAMEVNFSLELVCMANLIIPDLCTIENALPWMDAMLAAIERDKVKVRVMMENTNSNGLENRVSGKVFLDELKRRGLDGLVELRFYNGKIHAKSILIDDAMLIIGSQNLHYSAWGEKGLAEYSLTTDDPTAIAEYKAMFEEKWQDAVPFEDAEYGTSP